jgi:hypothetical protein
MASSPLQGRSFCEIRTSIRKDPNGRTWSAETKDPEGFISANISNTADFTAELTEGPTSASDIFAEFTFTADSSFDWAGYSIFGYYTSGLEVSFTVTITPLP